VKPASGPGPHLIGSLTETSLHAALKKWYSLPGDEIELKVEGYYIDIVRDDLLIEIQTRNFSAIKKKLLNLTRNHTLHLVHPIAAEKWILRQHVDENIPVERRKSPKRGRIEHLFYEMVRFPGLISNANFSLEILMTREEEIRVQDGKGSWRRQGWSISDRKLIEVISQRVFSSPEDFSALLPAELPEIFTSRQLATSLKIPANLASKMIYCLRSMEIIHHSGQRGRANLYSRQPGYLSS
jgi:hypothetical protein